MSNKEIVITSAFRTAIGSFGGSLSSKTAPEHLSYNFYNNNKWRR